MTKGRFELKGSKNNNSRKQFDEEKLKREGLTDVAVAAAANFETKSFSKDDERRSRKLRGN